MLYIGVAAVIFVATIGFRIQATLFQRHADKLLSGLSKLRIGITSKAETLALLHELHPVRTSEKKLGCGEDCYAAELNSIFSDWVFQKITRTNSDILYSTLSLWGMRYWDFEILVEFKSGTVSKFGYNLMIATPERGSPGVVVVGA